MTIDAAALRRAHYNATAVFVRRVHDELIVLRVRPDRAIAPYEAGQWISVGAGAWEPRAAHAGAHEPPVEEWANLIRRPFSIGSPLVTAGGEALWPADDDDFYEFYLALATGPSRIGMLAARLFAFEPGSRLWVDERPRGVNTLHPVHPGDNVLFVATGTGEAAHNRMIWELLRRGHRGRVAAVVSTRRLADQGYRAAHQQLMRLCPNYRYTALATREGPGSGRRLQDFLRSGALEKEAGFALDPQRTRVFLCGRPEMIGAPRVEHGVRTAPHPGGMIELLENERGFSAGGPESRINLHFERYE